MAHLQAVLANLNGHPKEQQQQQEQEEEGGGGVRKDSASSEASSFAHRHRHQHQHRHQRMVGGEQAALARLYRWLDQPHSLPQPQPHSQQGPPVAAAALAQYKKTFRRLLPVANRGDGRGGGDGSSRNPSSRLGSYLVGADWDSIDTSAVM
jgi:hypothetical protein